jgi:hypothetical protein
MANRPANAGSGRGLAPMGDIAPPLDAAAPPPVHHDARISLPRAGGFPPAGGFPSAEAPAQAPVPPAEAPVPPAEAPVPLREAPVPLREAPPVPGPPVPGPAAPGTGAPRAVVGHRTARRLAAREREAPRASLLAWVPYLIVLAGAAAGMFVVWQGPKYAGRGSALLGCSLLAAALGRLILPPRYAGLLSTRRKASDVLTFAVFGTAVIAVALMLP